MSQRLPWRPISLAAKRVEAAQANRIAALRRPVLVRSFELTPAGTLLTHASTR